MTQCKQVELPCQMAVLMEACQHKDKELKALKRQLAEADATIAALREAGVEPRFPHVKGRISSPCWGWFQDAERRHASCSRPSDDRRETP